MEVQLYVYDLSNGLAKQISLGLLGKQIDAVYHTSIVLKGIEYVYDGGIRTINAGMTHLGRPMNIVYLGITELPMDVIREFLESLKDIYTEEAYDIWTHNCNNFSNDFATFLIGHGIPSHISNLPTTVLNTPFGRMLKPHIDDLARRRQTTKGGLLGIKDSAQPQIPDQVTSAVRATSSQAQLDTILKEAAKSCAVVFFTSEGCAPCRSLYPMYQELANVAKHKATFIIVDISRSQDIGQKYKISATPTFVTFLHGEQENRWSGADPSALKGNTDLLIQMAWPAHPHQSLNLPAFRGADTRPVLFSKLPPLGKLKSKMGPSGEDAALVGVMHFVSTRAEDGVAESTLPDLDTYSRFMRNTPSKLPPETMFAIVDLMRIAMVDTRFSGYFAEEKDHKTVAPLLSYVNSVQNCPYSLRLVTLQLACNLFTSPLYPQHILGCPSLTGPIVQLITTSLLDDKHHNVRVAAASLAFNIAVANGKLRMEMQQETLPEAEQVELAASILEAISVEEESPEALKGFLLAFGFLVFCASEAGELVDMLKSMDAQGTVLSKQKLFPKEPLVIDIGKTLLGK